MEAQKALYLPTTSKVKELINSEIIGKIKYLEFKAGFPGRFTYDRWMYDLSLVVMLFMEVLLIQLNISNIFLIIQI